MSSKSNVECLHCGAQNPHDYTFCYHCRAVPGSKPAAARRAKAPKKPGGASALEDAAKAATIAIEAAARKKPSKRK